MPTGDEGFVGRERELARVTALLAESARMVTLVGSGGIGKTRLAMAVTARLREVARLPVFWVHLARLPKDACPGAVRDEIVAAVLDGDFSGRTAREALIDTLGQPGAAGRPRRRVLVLDNCEHVLEPVGTVIADLLAEVPELAVLATSRTAIGWVDEHIVAIPPLSRDQARDLFRRRAEQSGHPVADGDLERVDAICARLHHYPLHIRLAAARLRYQSPAMILRDLGDGTADDRRLRWPGFRVGADDRHRDLGAVIAWSYDLCEPKERLLFERLSVFAVGYDTNPEDADRDRVATADIGADLEAVESICAGSGLARAEIEPLLRQLVDRSLVSIHVGAESARYSLLESFQVFARERLRQAGDSEWLRLTARHRHYYGDQVIAVATGWVSPREQELLAQARAEWDNIVHAIEGCLSDPAAAVLGLELAVGLLASRIPFLRGSLRESRGLAERALVAARASGRCPAELDVSARASIGWIAVCQGMAGEADRILEECVADCLDPGDRENWRADPTVDPGLPAAVENLWGGMLWQVHADPRAAVVFARARRKFEAAGDMGGAVMCGLFEALSAAFLGTAADALAVTGAHLDAVVAAGPQWALSWARFARAIAISAYDDPVAGLALCDAGLAWQLPMRDHWGGVWGLTIRARILSRVITADSARGRADIAVGDTAVRYALEIARLTGRAAAIRRRLGIELTDLQPFAQYTDDAADAAVKVLGHKVFATAVRDAEFEPGADRLLSACPSTMIPVAGHTDSRPAAPAPAESLWEGLTHAEREVAVLVAAGLTNTAIAARRGTSSRTVDAQVAAILSKLMINSRKDIRPLLPVGERDRAVRLSAAAERDRS
ncbi:hypothetical protein GPX89_28585 [Nocardia sp. ET3-3]|uniref:HTH luxR-type domain-containing protein n=1 Tax=Nocardia terrae TaxID=2675851 RepID=A0A7K1V423_9NOCA|nr:AAA family ATPase [Nocardia terrae]MVU81189.1 hypothetical protein [Nocardia terrae]